ncbi:MAG: hypothetical protein JSW61_07895 [Candidatus Thorarchaeota archaeon]|nr:MAG: hypothetical protein JSW61_07895 [Candidatus Thorarchaeota archaeon]
MADSVSSILSRRTQEGETYEPIGRLAGIGSLLGILAAAIGLLMSAGTSLLPIPSIGALILRNPDHYFWSAVFMGVLGVSALLQAFGSKGLRKYLDSGYTNILFAIAGIALVTAIFAVLGGITLYRPRQVVDYVVNLMSLGAFFAITWQLISITYVDSTDSWIGFLAGILNAMFVPFLALGQGLSSTFTFLAYFVLLLGQLFALLFWWSPMSIVREYARSTSKAKFAFGLAGLFSFLYAIVPILIGPLSIIEGSEVWTPWSTMLDETLFVTDPVLIFGLMSVMLFWVMLGPRLGARELKVAHVGEDIVKGGPKWFMALLAMIGIFAASQAGSMVAAVVPSYGLALALSPAAVTFMMGAIYAGRTDIITGLPLVVLGVMFLVHPNVLSMFVIVPLVLVIITQVFLTVETRIRGFTGFSQGALTVIATVIASGIFILFLLGGFGSGPAAMWPVNRWYPVALIPGISVQVQMATIITLPFLALLIRNVSLVGYAHGRGMAGSDSLGAMSILFAFLIPMIGDPTATVTHKALTAASILLALYAISFVLVLSLNLNLAGEVEDTGNPYEGMLIRMSAIVGIAFGSIVAIITMATFSQFYVRPADAALVITLLVTLVVGLEVLGLATWLITGVRLGMLRSGWKYVSAEEAARRAEMIVPLAE